MHPIIGWNEDDRPTAKMWRPRGLSHAQWPPDYDAVWRWRHDTLRRFIADPMLLAAAKTYYTTRPAEFIMDWMDTYDPRRDRNKWTPFVFFQKQVEFIEFLKALDEEQESGLDEKTRDMGATWACCAYSIWCWLFKPNDATGWGSRKEALVDKLGDADSIFEKMRLILKRLPAVWLPADFNWARHATFMKLINPENGASITGEAGDNIGRGGRKSRFFKDEAAHYERPEKIEAALGDTTNVQIDISSVNGVGNVFHRRREHGVMWQKGVQLPKGVVRIFVMDWKDHPLKNQAWYDARRAKYEREGMMHVFAQEVDRNYSAAIQNTVIPMEWINAAKDAHLRIPGFAAALENNRGKWSSALDVADGGMDRNAQSIAEWVVWRDCEEWGSRDVGVTARKAVARCRDLKGRVVTQYDCIGVGSGVKAEYNRLVDDKIIDPLKIPFIPWNAGAKVVRPFDRIIPDDEESIMNKDFYKNLKAQAWWSLRGRFYKTWKVVTAGEVYPFDELISLDTTMVLLEQLCKELAQPTHIKSSDLRLMIDKVPDGTKSPNLADSGVMMYYPVDMNHTQVEIGQYGN